MCDCLVIRQALQGKAEVLNEGTARREAILSDPFANCNNRWGGAAARGWKDEAFVP